VTAIARGRIVRVHEPDRVACPTRGRKEHPTVNKILVAYDGGDPAHRALETAAELARLTGASVAVVSVVPTHPGRFPVDPWDDTSVHAQELLEARRMLREKGIEAELIEPTGDPAPTIERIAEEGGYDTVVIGSRGLNAMGRILQGSVSEHVATHAKATVVVAR
jgi:nucleotide-binding universal stress UspA family protein